jgi:hypothetical protein
MSAKRELGAQEAKAPRDLEEKTGRRSDVRQKFARFAKPDPALSQWTSGRAPALHASDYLTTPAFETHPFRFAHPRRMRPLSVGRLDNASHPAMDYRRTILKNCEEITTK